MTFLFILSIKIKILPLSFFPLSPFPIHPSHLSFNMTQENSNALSTPVHHYRFDEEAYSWGIREKTTSATNHSKQYYIPFYIPRRQLPSYRQRIPLVLYHTFKSHWVDEDMYLNIRRTLEFNPEYDYYFYTDPECLAYLTRTYGPQYSEAFQNLVPGAFKADFWRYCILFDRGGVYLDVDLMSHQPLHTIVHDPLTFVSVIDRPLASIYQAMIAAIPHHAFLKSTLYLCFENLQKQDYGEETLDITGPTMMGKALNLALKRNIHHFFREGDHFYQNQMYRLLINNGTQVTWQDTPIFSLKYETYDNSQNSYGAIYARREVWKRRHEFSQVHLITAWVISVIVVLIFMFILYKSAWVRNK